MATKRAVDATTTDIAAVAALPTFVPELKRRVDALFSSAVKHPPANRQEAAAFCERLHALGQGVLQEAFTEASDSAPTASKRHRFESVVCNGSWEKQRRSLQLETEMGPTELYEPVLIDLLCNPEDAEQVEQMILTRVPVRMFRSYFFSSGCRLWDASVGLARWLTRHHDRFGGGRRVLEIGAGCGCAGLTAAVLGCEVTLTDNDQDLLPNLRYNASQVVADAKGHHRFIPPKVAQLDWSDDPAALRSTHGTFGMVLASDVVYSSGCVENLISALGSLLFPLGELVMCYPEGRHGQDAFASAMRRAGWSLKIEKLDPTLLIDCEHQGAAAEVQAHQFWVLIAERPRPEQ